VTYELILVDDPRPAMRRITLNRPEKRNALNHALRTELISALREADQDPEVRVMIVRGAGSCFSAGYDLGGGSDGQPLPGYSAPGDGQFQRNVTEGWMSIWDLAKPVIAQVHSYCLAGGSELATGCDLVFVAEDAKIGYPAVRFGVPDMQFHAWFMGLRTAMMMMITGDAISGVEAAQRGWANEAVPADQLEARVIEVADRIAQIPTDIVQINKRTVHRAMDTMGLRAAIRAGTDLSALAVHQATFKAFIAATRETGLTKALSERDRAFGDYRTSGGG
jgi:enoyl-CoA hydratase